MSEDLYRKVTKGMFFEYTLEFTKKYPIQNEENISIKAITDFIDQWVDEHFDTCEDEDASE